MRRQRNAKIVATLGPASSDLATVRALFDAGAARDRGHHEPASYRAGLIEGMAYRGRSAFRVLE